MNNEVRPCDKSTSDNVKICDKLMISVLIPEFKNKNINLKNITSYNCYLSDFVENIAFKQIVFLRNEKFDTKMKLNNIRVSSSVKLNETDESIYEDIEYIFETASQRGKKRYKDSFSNPLSKIKRIIFHTKSDEYKNINSLIVQRDDRVHKNKRIIFEIINNLLSLYN